ncbi:hypothetical protein ENBRE01_2000 [Enteropsectra breve]|nr:hypothetical protein ENBRE01_2000 [Enteropsectra breve]
MFVEPTEILKIYLEERVEIALRDGDVVNGMLRGFDEHQNVLIEGENDVILVKGENILFVGKK